jgi:hypothetical protein
MKEQTQGISSAGAVRVIGYSNPCGTAPLLALYAEQRSDLLQPKPPRVSSRSACQGWAGRLSEELSEASRAQAVASRGAPSGIPDSVETRQQAVMKFLGGMVSDRTA